MLTPQETLSLQRPSTDPTTHSTSHTSSCDWAPRLKAVACASHSRRAPRRRLLTAFPRYLPRFVSPGTHHPRGPEQTRVHHHHHHQYHHRLLLLVYYPRFDSVP